MHIGAIAGLEVVSECGAASFAGQGGVDACLQIAFALQGQSQCGRRIAGERVVVDDRRLADAVHQAVEEIPFVRSRKTIDAQRHFDRAQPARVVLLAHITAIVRRRHLRIVAGEVHPREHQSILRQKAHGRTSREERDEQEQEQKASGELHNECILRLQR